MADYKKVNSTDEDRPRRKMSSVGASMEQGTWDADMNMIPPIVNGLWFYDKPPRLDAFVQLFEEHVWPNYRFHSLMDGGYWKAVSSMNKAYHFNEVSVHNEAAIDAYVQNVMLQPLDMSFPAWNFTLIRAAPPSRSAVLFRLHHSISDGLGLILAFSPFLGCEGGDVLTKIPLPPAVLPPSYQKKSKGSSASKSSKSSCVASVCSSLAMCMRGACSVLSATHDSELKINAPLEDRTPFVVFNGQRVYTRLPAIPISAIKAIGKKFDCTINDVLMAALTGGLRNYGAQVRGDARLHDDNVDLNFTAMVMIGLPRPMDEDNLMTAMHNNMLFAGCELPIDDPTPYGRLIRTIEEFNNLKSKPFMVGLNCLTQCLAGCVPAALLRKAVSETFSKRSLLVTNVPGPTVPVTFPKVGGEVVREMHMVFPNVIPQVSFISYNGFLFGNIVADPQLFPEATKLGALFEAEFAAIEKSDPADHEWHLH